MLLAFIFVPLLGAAIMPIIRKTWNKGAAWIMTLISIYLVAMTGWIAYNHLVSGRKLVITEWLLGQKLALTIDGLSLVALAAIGLVALVTAIYSMGFKFDPDRRPGYNALLLLIVTGMNGLVMATDLFSLYVFLEIVSLTAYILIAFQNDIEGLEGSFKYFMLSAVPTVFLLLGISILFAITGSVSFTEVAAGIKANNLFVQLGFAFIIFAFLVKAGMIPFHAWLPDAYTSASAPVSILLAGIVTKICGVYTLMRVILAVFGFSKSFSALLLFIGAVSVVFGAFLALGQKNFKRMLAFSSISQIGYMMMGFATGSPLGLIGAAFHFFNHAAFKSLLFINAGAVEQATGTRDFDKLGGLASKMPVTGVTSVIGLLSTAGIPPLGGFWSKLIIIIALWQGGYHSYALIAVLASVITLGYLLSLQHSVFFGKVKEGLENVHEVEPVLYWPAIIMAFITVSCGIFFWFIIPKLILPVNSLLGLMFK